VTSGGETANEKLQVSPRIKVKENNKFGGKILVFETYCKGYMIARNTNN
jgi:hypothetical protein